MSPSFVLELARQREWAQEMLDRALREDDAGLAGAARSRLAELDELARRSGPAGSWSPADAGQALGRSAPTTAA